MKGWGNASMQASKSTEKDSNVLGRDDFPKDEEEESVDFPEAEVDDENEPSPPPEVNNKPHSRHGHRYPSPGIVMKWVNYYFPDYELVPKMKLRRLKKIKRRMRKIAPNSFQRQCASQRASYDAFRPYPGNYVPPPCAFPSDPYLESTVVSPYHNPASSYAYGYFSPAYYCWY